MWSPHLVLLAWLMASLLLTGLWVFYRRFIGRHSLEEFDRLFADPRRVSARR